MSIIVNTINLLSHRFEEEWRIKVVLEAIMSYVAHAGIKIITGISNIQRSIWNPIKITDGISFRWRLNADNTYDVIAGPFDDKYEALTTAKQMYVTLIYSMLRGGIQVSSHSCSFYEPTLFTDVYETSEKEIVEQEPFFFWTKNNQGGFLGPGVYEVDSSLDEFDDYTPISIKIRAEYDCELDFDEVDTFIFEYSRKTQPLLNQLIYADNADDFGLSMTLFTSILEHYGEKKYKSEKVCNAIDQLIATARLIDLDTEEQHKLIGYLQGGKNLSSRSKCQSIAETFAHNYYGPYTTREIVKQAYSVRSIYAHGNECKAESFPAATYIKYVVMDVIKVIAQDNAYHQNDEIREYGQPTNN